MKRVICPVCGNSCSKYVMLLTKKYAWKNQKDIMKRHI